MVYVPEQELFDQLYIESEQLGYNTYDHLPLRTENAKYPFVMIGDTQQIPINYRTAIGGTFTVTLHVWGDGESRYTVSKIMERLAELGGRTINTEHFHFVGRLNREDRQIITDTSVPDTVLKHGILTLVFNLG
ncbi:DUF3168 domain-containing protein [Limosilactobacillus vaginalis]|uniref:DUF3168 domain-containing protein n=1 Tax=Limosilactobacillus vaginalis TaxID=1633 RepID=UPI0025A4976D|nr:DUF3168 domain-containing protein [Limosilactobacillus vaginalis]MDM8222131.1 DUF3168 domain-containing protein [Limosilactobacillus vaginalis]